MLGVSEISEEKQSAFELRPKIETIQRPEESSLPSPFLAS